MTKAKFIDYKEVKLFVEWLTLFWDAEKLPFSKYKTLKDASENYTWKKEDFEKTWKTFNGFNHDINSYINSNKKIELKDSIESILGWGGVKRGNMKHIDEMNGNLISYFKAIKIFLDEDIVSIEKIKEKKFISTSGFSKIYSAINLGYVIYDSRVAYAICLFIKEYFKNENSIPEPLRLNHGGRSSTKNRNPNDKDLLFADYTGRDDVHFKSLIKTKWILESVSEKIESFSQGEENKNLWRLQSALFMIGE